MKILFIGDIVGSPGRRAVNELLPTLRQKHNLDVVIANGENSAGGNGITPDIAADLYAYGIDAITTGDHLWDQKEVLELLQNEPRFVRPVNYPPGTPGRGSTVLKIRDLPPVAVMNAQGRTFLPPLENPFLLAMEEAKWLRQHTNIIFVDFHAEATSEKIAFARMLDGQVSAVVGTHTHVQTADEQIFPGGTAYLTDAGFTGPHASVLGREIQPVLQRFRTAMPQRFEVARDDVRLHGAIIEIDNVTGKATSIRRVAETLNTTS
ncbi:MAG TPA: TIGR00282 family metallophosphoesterase [Candidatus Acidoferrales bacterium]|nr:TIGR00282 family metallophosphoesterase [Candidatus Acidoferrales bacterium]